MSSVILTDIIQTVLETSECLLSNSNNNNNNNNMHILALWAHYSSKSENAAPYPKKVLTKFSGSFLDSFVCMLNEWITEIDGAN